MEGVSREISYFHDRPPLLRPPLPPEQVEQNVKACDWALTPEDLAEIDRLIQKA